MLPVEEDVFQRVSWNCANPTNNIDIDTQNRNVYFTFWRRIGKIFKIKNTESERNKSYRGCSIKPAWEGGILKQVSRGEKSKAAPEPHNTRQNIIQGREQVKIYSTERLFKSCNRTV